MDQNTQKGGELIHKSLSSCVFHPNIPCDSNDKISNKKLSKVLFLGFDENEQPMTTAKREIMMNNLIRNIKGHEHWSILYDDYCKAPTQAQMSSYDPEGVMECFKNIYNEKILYDIDYGDIDNVTSMLHGKIGGITLEDYFKQKFSTKKNLQSTFLKTMMKLKPIFLGLVKMKQAQIIHNDIKWNNIILDKGKFKLIDFGISSLINNSQFFKRRIQSIYHERFYLPYPYDYHLYYLTDKQLDKEFNSIQKYINERGEPPKQNIDIYNDISIFYLKSDVLTQFKTIDENIEKKMTSEKDILQGIDVYSLGICMILLIEQHVINGLSKTPKMIGDFIELFSQMMNPYIKYRLTVEQAEKQFHQLLKQYSKKKKQYSKKKKKYSKKKKKSSKKNKQYSKKKKQSSKKKK